MADICYVKVYRQDEKKKIAQLSKPAQKLVGILDATFDRNASGLIQLPRLAEVLWGNNNNRIIPKSTQASRIKKLEKLLSEITTTNIGYNIAICEEFCAILRGRKFRSLSESITWIEEAKRLDRYVSIAEPKANSDKYFWSDPFVQDMMALIDMGHNGWFLPLDRLDALYRFERPLLDMTPVLPWIERAHNCSASSDVGQNLMMLADNIIDPGVRRATLLIGKKMFQLDTFMGNFSYCCDAFKTVDYVLGVMDKVADAAPESYARLKYLLNWFESSPISYDEISESISEMLEHEKSGKWTAPDKDTLSQYLP